MSATTITTSKTSPYKPIQFHGVRAISSISSLVIISILVSFSIDLKNGGYKIPWTFLILLITSFASFAAILLTSLINCCGRLSPIFNLILNIPLLILWIVSLSLFSWNIYGALAHSCSISNWGSDEGVSVCSLYKGLYSCLVFGTLSQIAMIVVDIRARVAQNRSGEYEKMDHDVKLEPYRAAPTATVSQTSVHDEPYVDPNQNQYQYRDDAGWRPGQRQNDNPFADNRSIESHQYADNQSVQHYPQEQAGYNDHEYGNQHEYASQHGDVGTLRMDDFRNNHDVYQRPTYQSYHTSYENGQYNQRY